MSQIITMKAGANLKEGQGKVKPARIAMKEHVGKLLEKAAHMNGSPMRAYLL